MRRVAQAVAVSLLSLLPISLHAQKPPAYEDFDQGIARIASTLSPRVQGRIVAVFEFPDLENRITNLSRLVSEQLTTELVQQTIGTAKVLERRQVIQVLTELNLLRTDLTAEQVTQVGRQLGANAIVLGSATALGTRVLINARVVAVAGGEVLAADRLGVEVAPELLALAATGINAPNLTQTHSPPRKEPAAVHSGAAPATSSPPSSRPSATFRAVTMKVDSCTRSHSGFSCSLEVVNTDDRDHDVTLLPTYWGTSTRVVDGQGSEYRVQRIRFANVEDELLGVRRTLVSGVITPSNLTFDTKGAVVERIALLEVVGTLGDEQFVLRFRNINVR